MRLQAHVKCGHENDWKESIDVVKLAIVIFLEDMNYHTAEAFRK